METVEKSDGEVQHSSTDSTRIPTNACVHVSSPMMSVSSGHDLTGEMRSSTSVKVWREALYSLDDSCAAFQTISCFTTSNIHDIHINKSDLDLSDVQICQI